MNKSVKVRVLLALGACVLMGAPAALASGGLPKVPSFSGTVSKKDFKVRPSSIDYGMGQAFLAGTRTGNTNKPLSWTSWTASSGRGSGLNWLDNCKPNCAAGTYHSYPVKLKVWQPATVSGHLIFTRMTVTYTGKRPPRVAHATQVWKVKHNKNVFFWST